MYLDFELNHLIASLTAHSEMMGFVLDGRLDPLAELFGLVHREGVPREKVERFRDLLRDLSQSNGDMEAVRVRIVGQLPVARSGSETLQLRRAHALVDRLYQGNIRLAELILNFLAD